MFRTRGEARPDTGARPQPFGGRDVVARQGQARGVAVSSILGPRSRPRRPAGSASRARSRIWASRRARERISERVAPPARLTRSRSAPISGLCAATPASGPRWHAPALGDETLRDEARALIGYGLAKYHDRRSEFDEAASAGLTANAARRRVSGPLDRAALTARVDGIIGTYTARVLRRAPPAWPRQRSAGLHRRAAPVRHDPDRADLVRASDAARRRRTPRSRPAGRSFDRG